MQHSPDLQYAATHEWAKQEGDLIVTGISDFAQNMLGDLMFVEAPKVGTNVQAGQAVGTVESVKTASDIHAPVSGEVVEVNTALHDDPEIINTDPYGKGWIYKIRPSQTAELAQLLNAADYAAANTK